MPRHARLIRRLEKKGLQDKEGESSNVIECPPNARPRRVISRGGRQRVEGTTMARESNNGDGAASTQGAKTGLER